MTPSFPPTARDNIVSWNARAEAIFGYTAEDILGAPLTRLIPARYQAAHAQRLTQWSATGASHLVGTTIGVLRRAQRRQ